jgi:integrase
VAGARWRDVDFESAVWTLPETKSGRTHKLPLSTQATARLRQRGPGRPNDLVFTTETGGRLSNWDRETRIVQGATGTVGWTRHDLRRTGATMLGEMGTEPHIIEAALNHAEVRCQSCPPS